MRLARRVPLFAALLMVLIPWLSAAPAAAQTQITTAVIEGVVVDSSGGVLPGVDRRSEERRDTNLTRTLQTDPEGRFLVARSCRPAATPPPSRLPVSRRGSSQNAVVTVGQSLRLQVEMSVSAVEVVDVSAQTPIVDTTRTAATSTIDETTIRTTPILGRKFEDLLTLTPGVSVVQGPDGDEITFSGQRGVFNNISLDGGDYNNGFFGEQVGGQRAAVDITLDAVKEFQVVANGAGGRVRPHRRRRGERDHQVGHQRGARLAVLLPAPRGAHVEHIGRQAARRLPPRAVRRHARRPDREGSPVLLRRHRGHPRKPAAAEPVRADRHAVPGVDRRRSARTRR